MVTAQGAMNSNGEQSASMRPLYGGFARDKRLLSLTCIRENDKITIPTKL